MVRTVGGSVPTPRRLSTAAAVVHRPCFRCSEDWRGDMLVHVFEHAEVVDQPPPGWSEEVFTPWREALEDGALALDMLREEQQRIGSAQAWRARWIAEFCRSRP